MTASYLASWTTQTGYVVSAVGVYLLVLTSGVARADNIDRGLLDTARAGNRAAIQAIRNFSCRVESKYTYTTADDHNSLFLPVTCDYWRSGDVIRSRNTGASARGRQVLDQVFKDGKAHTLAVFNSKYSTYAIEEYAFIGTDVWEIALLTHFGSEPIKYRQFDELCELPHTLLHVGYVTESDHRLVRIELKYTNKTRNTFWFDPAANYQIRKSEYVPPAGPDWRYQWEAIAFEEFAPGVFFPTATRRQYSDGKGGVRALETYTLSNIRINQDLSPSALKLPLPRGIQCGDSIRMKMYPVDEDGKRIGPEVSWTPVPTTVSLREPSNEPTSPRPPSRPPWPTWAWLLIGSIGVLILAGVARYLRRTSES